MIGPANSHEMLARAIPTTVDTRRFRVLSLTPALFPSKVGPDQAEGKFEDKKQRFLLQEVQTSFLRTHFLDSKAYLGIT